MIRIEKPNIIEKNEKVTVICKIFIDGREKELFYEIDKKYRKYLCIERSDAFIIAALYYAMKFHHDIICDIPISSELYHNITTYLIPTLAKHSDRFKEIKINAPITNEKLETYNAVGTGLSCGIDSFHVIKNYLNPECKDMKLTCVCLNNVGSFKAYNIRYRGIGTDEAREKITEKAKEVAKKLNLPIIITNSNLSQVFPEVYYRVHTFSNMFSVLLMQKYFGKYYYASSGYDLSHYNVVDTYELDSAEYDILTFFCLSTSNLKIYPEGNEKTRLEKTISIADFEIAQEHLHVCIKDSKNCGKCLKCRRTLLILDAIGKLDNFKKVFDIKYYLNHKNEYYDWLKNEEKENHEMNVLTSMLLKQKNDKTEYKDIEKFNEKNIIIPKLNIDSLSVKKDKSIINKENQKNYNTNLNLILSICIEIAKNKNKNIYIYKHYLDNVKETLKNKATIRKKMGYIKNIILKKKTKIKLYDLIYFILYKPELINNILKFLIKNKIIENKNIIINTKNEANATSLLLNFQKFFDYKILTEALEIDEKIIKGRTLKNTNKLVQLKDRYYKGIFDNTFVFIDKNRYFFLGKKEEYFVSIINELNENKNQIIEEITKVKGLINKI